MIILGKNNVASDIGTLVIEIAKKINGTTQRFQLHSLQTAHMDPYSDCLLLVVLCTN